MLRGLGFHIAVSFIGLTSCAVHGCGISWSEPKSHFSACNEQGYVLITEKLANIQIPGEEDPTPIYATFNSSRTVASPYLGMGWQIPFFECNLVQISEDEFVLTEPGGWRRLFRRHNSDSNLLEGGGNWKGKLSSEHCTLWADCGWRIDLHKGKIVQLLTPHGRLLSYHYNQGHLAEILCDGEIIASIEYGADPTGVPTSLTFQGKRYIIQTEERPDVEVIAGQNVIASKALSFCSLDPGSLQSRKFTYSVDQAVRPLMEISDPAGPKTTVSWDPGSRRIKRFGIWRYDVQPETQPFHNAAISRTNNLGQNEKWFYDIDNGIETVQNIDGSKRIKTWYSSGLLAGKVRKVEEVKGGVSSILQRVSYDETGSILREVNKVKNIVITTEAMEDGGRKTVTDLGGGMQLIVIRRPGKPDEVYKMKDGVRIAPGNSL